MGIREVSGGEKRDLSGGGGGRNGVLGGNKRGFSWENGSFRVE